MFLARHIKSGIQFQERAIHEVGELIIYNYFLKYFELKICMSYLSYFMFEKKIGTLIIKLSLFNNIDSK